MISGKRIFGYFFAFFCFVAAVNAVMITLAVKTNSGVVTEHPYEKGLAYNKVVEAEEKQEKLGWKSDISYQDGKLKFSIYDNKKQKLIPEKAMASFTRPTQSGMDFIAELTGEKTPIEFPAKGQWEVRVDAKINGVNYQKAKRIVVE